MPLGTQPQGQAWLSRKRYLGPTEEETIPMTCVSAGLHSPSPQLLEALGKQTPIRQSPRTEPPSDICRFWNIHTAAHTHILQPSEQPARRLQSGHTQPQTL